MYQNIQLYSCNLYFNLANIIMELFILYFIDQTITKKSNNPVNMLNRIYLTNSCLIIAILQFQSNVLTNNVRYRNTCSSLQLLNIRSD